MSKLFSPLTIRDISFRNRIAVSPMCQYSSKDGFANDWHLVHLGSRAVGGAGLVIQEATAVVPEGRISYEDMGIWKDEHIEKLSQIVSFIHEQGATAGIQLAHAGRKGSTEKPWKGGRPITSGEHSWDTVAPSPIAFYEEQALPREISPAEIAQVIRAFKNAALRSLTAGYQVIEIHAAHGYLIHQFLSPLSNHRSDEYGGSFENRIRLLLQIVDAVRTVWPPALPLFVRISATDWAPGGWDIEEAIQLAAILKQHEVDLIDVSSGGLIPDASIPAGPGYQVPFAARIKEATGMLTGAVGIITTADQAEEVVSQEQADLVFMARELLRDPYFPLHAAMELGEDMPWPPQYERAKRARK